MSDNDIIALVVTLPLGLLCLYWAVSNSSIMYGVANRRQQIGAAVLGRAGIRVLYGLVGVGLLVFAVGDIARAWSIG